MGYCEIIDVEELNTGRRTFSATSKPNATQVGDFIEQTAAVLDGILRSKGYSVPVPTSATSARKILELFNAQGAACMVEQSAPTTRPDKSGSGACAMWREAQKMLRSGELELDTGVDAAEALPRHGGCATPFFSRDMQL